jgi:hypothetical protein
MTMKFISHGDRKIQTTAKQYEIPQFNLHILLYIHGADFVSLGGGHYPYPACFRPKLKGNHLPERGHLNMPFATNSPSSNSMVEGPSSPFLMAPERERERGGCRRCPQQERWVKATKQKAERYRRKLLALKGFTAAWRWRGPIAPEKRLAAGVFAQDDA